jgi:multiple sugar transport system ATP-binding protein
MAEVRERVDRAARMLGLTDQVDRKPRQLSGGQRQRVAMGRAIVRDPQVFLMDEPLSNLDAKLRVQMRADIASLQRDLGTTTIYVTHDQVEAMTMGDRVAVMKQGVLQQCDTPQALYDDPDNLFVAGFIGSPPMNMGLGRVSERDGRVSVQLGTQELVVTPERLTERPGLRRFVGRDVAVGVRSEDMEDATHARQPDGQRLQAQVLLTEALGSEIVVRIGLDVEPVRSADVEELARDTGAADIAALPASSGSAQWLASFTPRSRVRPGDRVEVTVDTGRMHFFDPETGAAVRD